MQEFKVFRYEIYTEKLAAGQEGPKFVLAADLHNHEYGEGNSRLIDAVAAEEPDAVLVAGDLLIGNTRIPYGPALRFAGALTGRGIPVFYENGNHEQRMRQHPEIYGGLYADYSRALRESGVVLLENESARFHAHGLDMVIYGYELPERYYRKLAWGKLTDGGPLDVFGGPSGEAYNILLAHNPVYFEQYAAWGADLTLSGHLHGGVVRLPLIGGVVTPQLKLFPKYDAGHFQYAGKDLIVSRGLGTHTVNIRIFNPPELAVIRIKGR